MSFLFWVLFISFVLSVYLAGTVIDYETGDEKWKFKSSDFQQGEHDEWVDDLD